MEDIVKNIASFRHERPLVELIYLIISFSIVAIELFHHSGLDEIAISWKNDTRRIRDRISPTEQFILLFFSVLYAVKISFRYITNLLDVR